MPFSEKHKSHRRTVSANDACLATGSENENQSIHNDVTQNQMIGHHCSPKVTRHFVQGLSSTWSGKPPKVPQPEQTQDVFRIVGNGIREIIEIVKNDVSSLKFAADSASISSHQIRAAERYLKELEFHLSKLEELQERYEVQQKMRAGIRSMAYAYILSHGKGRESALHNVHSGYKECNELLCSYESKLQLMMGTFLFEMIGIQGFARMCSGDIFEIIIKHGDQKWKSRGHILKTGKQSWENKKVLFKSFFSEPLYIKAVEVRGLGKNILLGNKYCETKDLFSAHPQQMIVNLNPSGSLKLTLIITWNPVHCVSEEISTLHTRPPLFGSQSLLNCNSDVNDSVKGSNVFTSMSEGHTKKNTNLQESQLWSSEQSANSSDCNSIEMASSAEFSCSGSNKLQDVLCSLLVNLENVLDQYPDLDLLHNRILEIEKSLKFQQQSVLGSDVSISIKNALGCFDFLNAAVDGDEFDCTNERIVDKTAKTPCSEKSFIPEDSDNGDNSRISLVPSPLPLSSGIEQLDLAMITHAEYCLKLTEKLCSVNPMKFFELLSLEKLKKQVFCFSTFLRIIRQTGRSDKSISCSEFFLEGEYELQQYWMQLTETDSVVTVAEHFLPALEKTFHSLLPTENINIPSKVAIRILCKTLDAVTFIPETVVTVCHFRLFFMQYESVGILMQKIASEVSVLEDLKSKKLSRVKSAFPLIKTMLPFNDALIEISYFLINDDSNLKSLGECFLKDIAHNPSSKRQVTAVYSEGLEHVDSLVRQASCAALHLLEAYDSSEQLAYLAHNDQSLQVRQEAESAVLSFGATQAKLKSSN